MSFVHLHVHTQYSLLQGAIHVEDLIQQCVDFGMPAVAMTDTNNMFGAVDFYLKCKEKKIKPILGVEISYLSGGYSELQAAASIGSERKLFKPKFFNLVLLCKNKIGYQNLCHLLTEVYQKAPLPVKGQQPLPRFLVDQEQLFRYSEGLIVLSGGLKGEIGYLQCTGEEAQSLEVFKKFQAKFGEDYYLELVDSGLPEQDAINRNLYQWVEQYGAQVVGTSECHYLKPEDAEAHEILQCIESGRNLDFERPKSLVPPEFYFKPAALMEERLNRFPGAYENSLKIAEKCDVKFDFKDATGKPIYHLPRFRPDGVSKTDVFDSEEFFRQEAREGLKQRIQSPIFKNHSRLEEYQKRLEEEIAMIVRTGFSGYFLIVSDFIRWAKSQSIPVGPGRGSGAGSLVAYSLSITDIDPIEFQLLFERFINPERISMPDFDVDFCQNRRQEVIDYVSRKYGKENVCQIITYGKLQTRAVIKDVARVLGFSFAEADEINKLIPEDLGITLDQAIEKEPKIREKMQTNSRISAVIRYARSLEGLYRNAGVHAAGVIITEDPVVTYCPLYVGKDQSVVTQFDKDAGEKIGLIKFDFLGLKTLTVIDEAVRKIRANEQSKDFNLELMNYQDPTVFQLISAGDTDGVFQVESSGMKDLCTRIQPSSLEDITAINALYRPGPLGSGMVDDFIERKHGRKQSTYDVPALAPILKDTYGVILYQEQVMQIARELAGYSLGQADLLRRAMGKKKPEEMAQHRVTFVKGAVDRGLVAQKAESIFDLMAMFAEYGFNKSHSAAYGVLTYQTAYLKKHYTAEFMAALMTTEINNTDTLTQYISDARAHGLLVLSPDVNVSEKSFSVEILENGQKAIRFGLEAIKGVGGIAVDEILQARTSGGPFKDILDFVKRVSTRRVNKKVIESLATAGGFDSILGDLNRPTIIASIETLVEYGAGEQESRDLGQNSLFDAFALDEVRMAPSSQSIFKREADWPSSKKLLLERQTVGFFVSGHPMDRWQKPVEQWLGNSISTLKQIKFPKKTEVRVAGLLGETKEIMTRKGSKMGFSSLEDQTGAMELVLFSEPYQRLLPLIQTESASANPVLVIGDADEQSEPLKILVKNIVSLSDAYKDRSQELFLELDLGSVQPSQEKVHQTVESLKKTLSGYRGKCPVKLVFINNGYRATMDLPEVLRVKSDPQILIQLRNDLAEYLPRKESIRAEFR